MPEVPVDVEWVVAEDEKMERVVQRGKTTATPEWAHSVHVEVAGLQPDRWYWYQFKAGDELSPVGRTRTMPAAGSPTEKLRFAFASCQRYDQGFYTAYEHMANEDLDLVVFLGDYIYESGTKKNAVRPHNSGRIFTLSEYRNRIALYKTDPLLQRMHALVPWVVTWDDHETWNNMAGGADRSDEELARRAAAYKAYYEHMPLRRVSLPSGPDMLLYRGLSFGGLANFFVLDTRQYRTKQPKLDSPQDIMSPKATILGGAQREWLFRGLQQSPTQWNVLAQQVPIARIDFKAGEAPGYNTDKWFGYESERRRLLDHLLAMRRGNTVVITGDVHANYANDVFADYRGEKAPVAATEFVGTSITSDGDGEANPADREALLAKNPFMRFYNRERGYVLCELTPKTWRTDYRTVEYVRQPGAPIHTRASFVVENGRPGLQKA